MQDIHIQTQRGVLLDGTLFESTVADTLLIAITGIHGNFYSNPFYYTIGNTLAGVGTDFLYAQTCDAFDTIRTLNARTGRKELIGSWNERFADAEEDVAAYVDYACRQGYRHIYLAGHSLGANKVIYYLSRTPDPRVERFLLLSPANLDYMTSGVTAQERDYVRRAMEAGHGAEMLPFPLMGWVECQVATAYDWLLSGILNNVHTHPDGDFSQLERITHRAPYSSAPTTTSPTATRRASSDSSIATCLRRQRTGSSSSSAPATPTSRNIRNWPTT